jgi:hypothetical protein
MFGLAKDVGPPTREEIARNFLHVLLDETEWRSLKSVLKS